MSTTTYKELNKSHPGLVKFIIERNKKFGIGPKDDNYGEEPISNSFYWEDSPEGFTFWNQLHMYGFDAWIKQYPKALVTLGLEERSPEEKKEHIRKNLLIKI